MFEKNILRLFFCSTLIIIGGNCDISEYFQKLKSDAQMDFFQKMPPQTLDLESRSPPDVDFSDYYDYFGIDPSKDANLYNNIEDRENELNVAADVLSNVKKPSSSFHKKSLKIKNTNSRHPYKKRNPVHFHKDNIAVASSPAQKIMTKRVSRPKAPLKPSLANRHSSTKQHHKFSGDDISSKIQRLVPSKIKTVIEGGGKKIVKTVLQPVQKIANKIKNRVDKGHETERVESWFSPYRTYLDGIAPLFQSEYVTHQLVATWINAIASSVVWVFLGHFYTAASGRSFGSFGFGSTDEGRSTSSQVFPEAIEEFVPDSDTVAMVLREMAKAAEKWHDEL